MTTSVEAADAGMVAMNGSGGTPSTGAPSNEETCPASSGPIDPTLLIDDLEDGDSRLAQVGERNGGWWLATDMSALGTTTPASDQAPPPERILGGHCGSEYAIRVSGQGFSEWGALVIADLRFDSTTSDLGPIDASAFRGIRFWARRGEIHSSSVRLQFQDANTYPQGGVCNPEPMSVDECYSGFGTELIPLGVEWRQYQIPFERLAQAQFGLQVPEGLNTAKLYSIQWTFEVNSVFDLWIDDLWFYE